jgi:hypothetical protein
VKTPVNRRPKPRSVAQCVGYWSAKAALIRFGSYAFDGRTRIAKALDEFRDALVSDLGGPLLAARLIGIVQPRLGPPKVGDIWGTAARKSLMVLVVSRALRV